MYPELFLAEYTERFLLLPMRCDQKPKVSMHSMSYYDGDMEVSPLVARKSVSHLAYPLALQRFPKDVRVPSIPALRL